MLLVICAKVISDVEKLFRILLWNMYVDIGFSSLEWSNLNSMFQP